MKKQLARTLLFISCSLLLFSCQNPFAAQSSPQSIPAGKGAVTLIVNGIGRTVLPIGLSQFQAYTVTFQANGGTLPPQTESRTNDNLDNPFYLEPATYTIQVIAYADTAETQAAAKGQLNGITVIEGANETKTMTLVPMVTAGESGTFSWEIQFPADLHEASMTIDPLAATGTDQEIVYLKNDATPLDDSALISQGSLSLKTGYYRIIFNLRREDAKVITFKEFIHVYDYLETSFIYKFEEKHFNNIKYTVTFDYNDGITPENLLANYWHGEQIGLDREPKINKPTPAGLYAGTPPEICTFDGWYYNGVKWDYDDPVTEDMTLTAQWISSRIESAGENNVAAAVGYVNGAASDDAYTLLMGADVEVSSAISLANSISLTIEGQKAVTITLSSGDFMVTNSAQLAIGSNITFAGPGEINIGLAMGLSLSDNAAVQKLTLWAAGDDSCSSVNMGSDWTGSVASLNLKGNSPDMNTVIGYWLDKPVLKGTVTTTAVERFTTVNFMNSSAQPQPISTANGPGAPLGYDIFVINPDTGTIKAVEPAARVTSTGTLYHTLYAAINDPALPKGTADNPTEIVILKDITVPETGITITVFGYSIPAYKHIKLTVEADQSRTITASGEKYYLFSLNNIDNSLTLGPNTGGGILTLSGGSADATNRRHGVYVNRTFTMNEGVIITGFKSDTAEGTVYVDGNGTFTMNGGEISHNTHHGGGGVFVEGGTFNMLGGIIAFNNANGSGSSVSYAGGGVNVMSGTFNMLGGEIKNNIASRNGGGVYVYSNGTFTINGTFTMSGGKISGNTAYEGGGVYIRGPFTMSGGAIYGVDAPSEYAPNTATSTSSNSAAVFVYSGTTPSYAGAYAGKGYGSGTSGNDITTTDKTLPPLPGSAVITITLAQITDAAPNITGPTLSRAGKGTQTLTVPNDFTNVSWKISGTTITATGNSFTLDAKDSRYNQLGDHLLTLIAHKGGVPYNRTITFTIVQ